MGGMDNGIGCMSAVPRVAQSSSSAASSSTFGASSHPLLSTAPFESVLADPLAKEKSTRKGVGEVAEKVKSTTSTLARTSSGLHVPLSNAQNAPLPFQQGSLLGLDKSRELNMSGNLSLVEMLKTASATDLAMSFGINSSGNLADRLAELPEPLGARGSGLERVPSALSLCRNRSALKDLNSSEFSISGFLNDADLVGSQAAADLIAGVHSDAGLPQPSAA